MVLQGRIAELTCVLSPLSAPQDDDYALAKMLQEQERAFLMLNSGRAAENHPPEAGPSGAAGAAARRGAGVAALQPPTGGDSSRLADYLCFRVKAVGQLVPCY